MFRVKDARIWHTELIRCQTFSCLWISNDWWFEKLNLALCKCKLQDAKSTWCWSGDCLTLCYPQNNPRTLKRCFPIFPEFNTQRWILYTQRDLLTVATTQLVTCLEKTTLHCRFNIDRHGLTEHSERKHSSLQDLLLEFLLFYMLHSVSTTLPV